MPGWHEVTSRFGDDVRTVGIIEEQHPQRARLFLQWKQMDWPVLVDSLNLLGMAAVPVTLFIDEHGIVRAVNPARDELSTFLRTPYESVQEESPVWEFPTPQLDQMRMKARSGSAGDMRLLADALVLWGSPEELNEAIEIYQAAIEKNPQDGLTHFRLGVAFRSRYDSSGQMPVDFASAVRHWKLALDIDPNQYIWRRRIQQYGPRLDKPYAFYDWVDEARRDIKSRNEEPVELSVEPAGAELAAPRGRFPSGLQRIGDPDPTGRILRDDGLISLTTVVVPHTDRTSSFMGHVILRPNESRKAHWNNEVEDLIVWVDPPEGWSSERNRYTHPRPRVPVSREERRVEIELDGPADFSGSIDVPGYALYYVCEDVDGTCLYRRQDFSIPYAARE